MSKRKHSEIEDKIDKISDRAVRIKASRLQAKISFGHKSLKDALNLARGFERQKMGRRQKQASNEPHTLLRLREEVIVLKELDLSKTASDYLLKQMVKTKRIRESKAFIALFGKDTKAQGPETAATANVLGRLFKAKPVLDVVPSIMQGIRQVLGLDQSRTGTPGETVDPVTKDATGSKQMSEEISAEITDGFNGFPDDSRTEGAEALDSNSDLEDADLEAYGEMIVSSSNESDQDVDLDGLDPMEISDEEDHRHNREEFVSLSPGDDAEPEELAQRQRSNKPVEKVLSTSFLPSLSMGGYYSGSDSDEAVDDFDARGPALPKDRKNRRGQQARRQLAELKYGKDAKHLQKQQQTKGKDRGSGWDAKRGAVLGRGHDPRQKRFGGGSFGRSKGPTGANGDSLVGNRMSNVKRDAKKSDGPLHPSWEAAKKRKQETGKASFAGKKITFD